MDRLPSTLKILHLGVAGLGLYVSIEGTRKLGGQGGPAANASIGTMTNGFDKDAFVSSAFIVTIIALVQLAVLYYFHDFRGKEENFRVSYFVISLISLIFGTILLQGAVQLLHPGASGGDAVGAGNSDAAKAAKRVAIAGAVLGGLMILFNYTNLYHASYAKRTVRVL